MRIPSNSPITPGYGFGSTLSPYSVSNPHKGVDFQHVPDNIIYAPFAGQIIHGYNDRDGNGTYMYASNGDFHGLLHASQYLVPNGAFVNEGQQIAVMGDTGAAEGVHLHWCVKRNGVFIDPMTLVGGNTMQPTSQQIPDALTVQLAYNMGLRRQPKDEELKSWSDKTLEQLQRGIIDSTEYKNLWATTPTVVELAPGIYNFKTK
jgi:hypothetical protein